MFYTTRAQKHQVFTWFCATWPNSKIASAEFCCKPLRTYAHKFENSNSKKHMCCVPPSLVLGRLAIPRNAIWWRKLENARTFRCFGSLEYKNAMFFDTFEAFLEHHSDPIAISFGLLQEAWPPQQLLYFPLAIFLFAFRCRRIANDTEAPSGCHTEIP